MKKHLGIFISIFLAVTAIVGALFVFDKTNNMKINVCNENLAISNITLDLGLMPANATIPVISATETEKPGVAHTNEFTFTISNAIDLNLDDWAWWQQLYDGDDNDATNPPAYIENGTTSTLTLQFDKIYYIFLQNKNDKNIRSNIISIYPNFTIKFIDSNTGTEFESLEQNVSKLLITRPKNPIKNGYIFGGWYQDPECTSLWNFTTSHVTGDNTENYVKKLYAKWVNLECIQFGDETFDRDLHLQNTTNNTLVNMFVNNSKPITFKIDVQYGDIVKWYVNHQLVVGKTGSTFEYSPTSVGTHSIYCTVAQSNDTTSIKSVEFLSPVVYFIPSEFGIESIRNDRTSYTLRIKHDQLQSIDISKFAWYCNNELVTEGVYELTLSISDDVEVWAIYKNPGAQDISSNKIKLSTKSNLMNIPLILGIAGTALLAIIIFIIIRKKYTKYKNKKYATLFTWHKW